MAGAVVSNLGVSRTAALAHEPPCGGGHPACRRAVASSPAEWGVASQQGRDISNTLVVAWLFPVGKMPTLYGRQDASPPQFKGAQRAQVRGGHQRMASVHIRPVDYDRTCFRIASVKFTMNASVQTCVHGLGWVTLLLALRLAAASAAAATAADVSERFYDPD